MKKMCFLNLLFSPEELQSSAEHRLKTIGIYQLQWHQTSFSWKFTSVIFHLYLSIFQIEIDLDANIWHFNLLAPEFYI